MGGSGRPLFDLNELPEEEVNVDDCPIVYQPQKSLPVAKLSSSTLLPSSEACQRIQNNHAFTHASIGSCFQPFVRKEVSKKPKELEKSGAESNTDQASTSVASRFEEQPALIRGERVACASSPGSRHSSPSLQDDILFPPREEDSLRLSASSPPLSGIPPFLALTSPLLEPGRLPRTEIQTILARGKRRLSKVRTGYQC